VFEDNYELASSQWTELCAHDIHESGEAQGLASARVALAQRIAPALFGLAQLLRITNGTVATHL
jgi:hypothetical protein